MLNIVEGYSLSMDGPTAVNYHRIVEAMKFGAAQRTTLGDPSFVNIEAKVGKQISKYFASEIRANISDTRTFGVDHYDPKYDILINHGTTHLSVLDGDDMAVALTSTVNLEFGSRVMDPTTGIILNDQMDDFSTTNQTNGFGLRPSPYNKIVPGKRPLSSTSATIIERDGRVELVVGGSGGSRILTSVLQVIINVLDFGMRLDQAVDMPRLHHQLLPHELGVDPLFPSCLTRELSGFGHQVAPLKHGSSVVQAVQRSAVDGTIFAVKYIALAVVVGQAAAVLDLTAGKHISETIFGLSPEQVKKIDTAIVRAEANAQASFLEATKDIYKYAENFYKTVDKGAGPSIRDASVALNKALTPELKQKLKKAISTFTDSTLNALL
ncbi:hypothetical protein LPJ66_007011 [Kickxella alabastrina]|uniref:Uncharacterized protein n=1 Tax=Kickxella alabastrina TaxID=61397 RepID=A0ACC1IDS6_9FUNG|nr:hypothetical protein LPJ66_007011 [Kickxella alabastrina]